MLGKHSFSHPMHQRKNGIQNKCQFRNTKLKFKKKKTNNANLMSQNHHQILENDRLPMGRERERERERDGKEKEKEKEKKKKTIQSNEQQIKK